jgi:glycerol kinase
MITEELRKNHSDLIKERTGLIADSYFSGPKIKWLIDSIPGLREKCEKGEILFGNVDSFLIWHLTGGKSHTTDYTNASRTMLFNIHKLKWDDELLEIMKVPEEILPVPKASSNKDSYGHAETGILGAPVRICGDAGDQQAALFGQTCFTLGAAKCTYGTGNFVLVNIGAKARTSKRGLLTTVAYGLEQNKANYALEGSIFITGAAIQWLRDEVKIISSPEETAAMAKKIPDTGGVYFVPAFTGLGAPYWDQYSRGLIIGITRGTSREHVARAALEAIAYQTKDVIDCMEADVGQKIENLRVDGGASANDFLMQFQADILNKEIMRPSLLETTSLGAAFLAGLATGFWNNTTEISGLLKIERIFRPRMKSELRQKLYENWTEAVKRASKWALTLNKTEAHV